MSDIERAVIGFTGLFLFFLGIVLGLASAGFGKTGLGIVALGCILLGTSMALYATIG